MALSPPRTSTTVPLLSAAAAGLDVRYPPASCQPDHAPAGSRRPHHIAWSPPRTNTMTPAASATAAGRDARYPPPDCQEVQVPLICRRYRRSPPSPRANTTGPLAVVTATGSLVDVPAN